MPLVNVGGDAPQVTQQEEERRGAGEEEMEGTSTAVQEKFWRTGFLHSDALLLKVSSKGEETHPSIHRKASRYHFFSYGLVTKAEKCDCVHHSAQTRK